MRVEVLEGVERRRCWSADEKMRIVEETLQPGAKVTDVAQRNQVSRSLVFAWRRMARSGQLGLEPVPAFVPVQVEASVASDPSPGPARESKRSSQSPRRRPGLIEIDLVGGRRVRVDAQFDAEALSRLLDLLERR
jgi:transposase